MDIISTVIFVGLLQGGLILFVFADKKRLRPHRFLVLFMTALLFAQLHSLLLRTGLMFDWLFLLNTNVPFILLFGPLIYFYNLAVLNQPCRLTVKLLHLLPFAFYLLYSFNFFLQDEAFKYNVLIRTLGLGLPLKDYNMLFPMDPWNIQGWVVVELLSVHLFAYGIFSLVKIYQNRKVGKQWKSISGWLKFLNFTLCAAGLVMFFSEGGVVNGFVFFESPFPKYSGDLFSTVALYGSSLYLIRKPEFLNIKRKKYTNSSLSKSYKQSKLTQLMQLMESDKLYLSPDFSMDLLSATTGVTKHHISQIINEELGFSFFELTNNYRIEEAKRLLKEADYIKMEQLAMQLGYKSKSSFFNAFKKATNLTPSKYLSLSTT